MTSATSLRLAARLARREVRRRPWRTLLVAFLVALPVAGMTTAAAFVRTDRYDAQEMWEATWGPATDIGYVESEGGIGPSRAPQEQSGTPVFPPGSRTTTWRTAYGTMRTLDKERAPAEVRDLPLSDGVGAGVVQITRGNAPTARDEVFLTRDLADDLGVDVGDVLELERPARVSWRVVGVGEQRAYWGSYVAFVGPGTAFPWERAREMGTAVYHAVDLPEGVTARQAQQLVGALGQESLAPRLQAYVEPTDSNSGAVAWSWVIGGIVLTVVGIVIASAFAAGARRQLTTLGQLAANGAAPTTLHRVLFLQGTWTGIIGTLLGLALGGLGLWAVAPHADRLFGRDVAPWDMRATDLGPVVLLGVLAATVAASIPARTTVRVPVLAALAGRRPLAKVPRWVTVAGAAAMAGGLALFGLAVLGGRSATHDTELWALTAVVGGMGVLLGACAMTPGYTSLLEPWAARLGGSWRLAARSLARQRTRTSAVVAGVCAASALAVGASAMVLSIEAQENGRQDAMRRDEVHVFAEVTSTTGDAANPEYRADPAAAPADLLATLRSGLAGAEVLDLPVVRAPSGLQWQLDVVQDRSPSSNDALYEYGHGPGMHGAAVFEDTAERAYGLHDDHESLLRKHGALVLGRRDAQAQLSFQPGPVFDIRPPGAAAAVARPVVPTSARGPGVRHDVTVVDGRDYRLGNLPRLLLTPALAERLGFEPRPPLTIVRTPEALTADQRTFVSDTIEDYRLDTAAAAPGDGQLQVFTEVLHPPGGLDPLLLEAVLTAMALLFSLFVVAVSLALATAETRDERDVLTVVGASPRTMRETSGRKAVILTALGGALAVPVGFLPVVVFVLAGNPTPPLVFPWRTVLLLLLVVPVVAGLATTASSALALRARPVRISTMAFD